MMDLGKRIARASWAKFAAAFSIWFAYNLWAINLDSPWTRSLAAGGGKLPESQFGFPTDEPQRSLARLAEKSATGDYLAWQALDIPYAALNVATPFLAIALALKAMKLGATPFRFLLVPPFVYFASELAENSLLAAFAADIIAPAPALVLLQQAATNLKLYSGYGSMGLALLGLVAAAVAAATRLLTRRA